ncbi:helix-turn-helix domain-containing protein [Gilliamella apicola]|uniref:helix-turn-helix domain-containing protein n=1 Tax=Gilliamella apicola TaxID=1196095 RepID=UPI000D781C48|nr:helix-turn-helix domain-containing protein [Gilliamella apicola]PXZ00428.1 hypothetical protein DKK69_06425 [Gilliamella apicola]WLS90571.1 helix-turn-helix domain-containing protein [Gilliamella apicola]
MSINFNSGGAKVLDRIIEAYGFKSKVEYSNYLGTSAASLSIRYRRDLFPSDLVVKCMDETGASLQWLATGEGQFKPVEQSKEAVISDETLVKLERLANLKDKGAITEQEFSELKGQLI